MSTIITFYSYKGGVGRSMALANVAVLMARRGFNVLVVDWDLEAPGIERFFAYFDQTASTGGLLPFFIAAAARLEAAQAPPGYQEHLWHIDVGAKYPISLLPSGRDVHVHYAKMLEQFDWQRFFVQGGGDLIEHLRNEWRAHFDFVLVDSRTGMSDLSGICTIQVPDVLVAMFTANDQSMLGVRDIIYAAQRGRQHLAYDRMVLTVLPILSRFSSTSEFQESMHWLDRCAEHYASTCADWLPQWVPVRTVFERLKIPQVDWFGFGERLAVIEQGVAEPGSIGFALDRITDLLVSDFRDIEAALGGVARQPSHWSPPERRLSPQAATVETDDYEYDVFVSFRRVGMLGDRTETFVHDLMEWLARALGRAPRMFFDVQGVELTPAWDTALALTLQHSKLLLILLTPTYFASTICTHIWETFSAREHTTQRPCIVPLLVRGEVASLPHDVRSRRMIDASSLRGMSIAHNRERITPEYAKLLEETARALAQML